jgi:hypothetical protein
MSYMTTLTCFTYKMNWNNCWFGVSLVNCPTTMWVLLVTWTWVWMVRVINAHSSLNFDKQKFVKVLSKPRVACIMLNTFQTPTSWFINCLGPGSNSFALKSSHVLVPTIDVANTIWCHLHTSQTSFHHYLMKGYKTLGC